MNIIKWFKALNDETRLRLFNLLLHHELNVNEIVMVMGMGQSRISRHLKILSDCGLMVSRRDGIYIYYRALKKDGSEGLIEFIQQSVLEESEFINDLGSAETILEERKVSTKRFFSRVAAYWDRLKRDVLGDLDLKTVITEKTTPCDMAVDLGCGTGELILELAKTAKTVIGVDNSPEMLKQAEIRLKKANTGNIQLRLGELEHIPMGNQEADAAFVNMVLHHLPAPSDGIKEAGRILKAGGNLIIADFNRHDIDAVREKFGGPWMGFEQRNIENWLHDAGFKIYGIDSFPVRLGLTVNLFVCVKE